MLTEMNRLETFLTTGWARFIGVPIVIAILGALYFALG
jgi:hypothetical protein